MASKSKKKDETAARFLGKFEGLDVVESSIAIVGAGDGLSKALDVDPVAISLNEQVFVVLECHASQIKFKAQKDDPSHLIRTIVLSAGVATIVDEELVRDVLDAQQDRLDEHAGITKLPFADDETGDPGD